MHTFNGLIVCLCFFCCSNLVAKSKSHSGISAPIGLGPQLPPLPLGGGFVKLRHVAKEEETSSSSTSSAKESPDKQKDPSQEQGEASGDSSNPTALPQFLQGVQRSSTEVSWDYTSLYIKLPT